jgi:UDP-N-acetylmuramate--alanine ligase
MINTTPLHQNFSRNFSPLNVGLIHFVGIGGIGMSGIAEILHHLGYKIQGSDIADNANVKRLRNKGIPVSIGHKKENLGEAQVVVISSAVKKDNPEVLAARESFLPVVRRAEMLGELMRLKWSVGVGGTHGKTTTTSMVATLFDEAGLDPTVINGGIINAYGTNARLGSGEWMVVETDESDGSFTKLPATICIVTNMDPEHLDHYKNFDAVRKAYTTFVENIPFYGFAVLCVDHPEVQSIVAKVQDRRVITYGFSPQADVRAINIETCQTGSSFDVQFTCRKTDTSKTIKNFSIPVIGLHNIQNVLSALAIGWQLGFSDNVMLSALKKFEGVKRRFTKTGTASGITIIDDYAHHPTEISATLKAALQAKDEGRKIIAVMQPHRYSRLHNLFKEFCTCFNDADYVFVADVYPAGEQPIDGATKESLVEGLRAHGHREAHVVNNPDDLPRLITSVAQSGDYIICLGAGSVSSWAYALPSEIESLYQSQKQQKA